LEIFFTSAVMKSKTSHLLKHFTVFLTLAAEQLKTIGHFCEKTASAFLDAVMDTALACVGLSKNNLVMKPES